MPQFECPFSFYSKAHPDAPALLTSRQKWSYLECEKWIQGTTLALSRAGVRHQDSVAIFPTKEFPMPLLFFSLFRIGALCSLIPTTYPLAILPQFMKAFNASFFIHPNQLVVHKMEPLSLSLEKIFQKKNGSNRTFLHKEQIATQLFTSGTTDRAKIACHTLGNHYYSALGSSFFLPIGLGDVYHLSLPLHHIAGIALLFRTFLRGGAVSLGENVNKVTHLSLVPTQLKRLLEKSNFRSDYKHILLGGAPISPLLYERALAKGLPIRPTYGMTEMSSQIATHFNPTYFSLGHPLPYRELKIGKEKEILVKGRTLFKGYLNQNGSYDLSLNKEGYFETNDLGTYCPTFGLQVFGRKDRVFISGGENIYPEEIEKHLLNLEGVIKAKVAALPDDEYGSRPKALIESEKIYRKKELENYLSQFLPKYKIPVIFTDFHEREIL